MKIATLGPEGTFSHAATLNYKRNAVIMFKNTIWDVFDSVKSGEADRGIVPIENSISGNIGFTLDGLLNYNLQIYRELLIPIIHNLSGGGKLKDINYIYSHPQAYAQCENFIRQNLNGVKIILTTSNADSASKLAKNRNKRYAAIIPKIPMEKYKLKCIFKSIQDNDFNTTRFVVLNKKSAYPTKTDRTSLVVYPSKDRPGIIYDIASEFAKSNINITKIESMPSKGKLGSYIIFIEVEGHQKDNKIIPILKQIDTIHEVKILGAIQEFIKMEKIAKTLHPLERKALPFLQIASDLTTLAKESGMQEIEAMRALQWLSNKKVIKLEQTEKDVINLGKNGRIYKEKGLPEKRFLTAIKNFPLTMAEIQIKAELDQNEINICIGTLKKKAAIIVQKEKELQFSITDAGKNLLSKQTLEEKFLEKDFPLDISEFEPEEKFAYDALIRRKDILILEKVKTRSFELTSLGKKLIDLKLSDIETTDKLTPQMMKDGSWKKKSFRAYDVSINVPKISAGKKHFVSQAVDYIKKIWLELGFKEMTGNIAHTAFWDLDALFVPQDHPAREEQDTFYIKDPKHGTLPNLWKKIKEVHNNGSDTGSKGWGGKYSEQIAKENLLRTHTTVLSALKLAKLKKEDLPQKFFTVGKVFRNESLDYKHLFEFYQVDGIVVDPNADFTNLKGYLREFFTKMGFPDVRIRPGHFPYTEPSAEVEVFHPVRKEWIELGGAGIFRPELTKPLLGFECPVLAWGIGLGRIIMEYWKLNDIRDLYKNDLKQIREMKYWMK